jgi:Uma2 family endonuclease
MSVDPQPLTLAEFLAWEERQSAKFEYRAGAIFAMAGATDDHGQIVSNLITLIRPRLRRGPCRVYPQDMKVVTDFPGSRYPDIVVTCDPRDAQDRLIKRHPKILIEVLSKKTASVDKADKLDEYETIAELEEYVMIDSLKPHVRIYRRNVNKLETEPAAVAGFVDLRSIDLRMSFEEIYEDVLFPQSEKPGRITTLDADESRRSD